MALAEKTIKNIPLEPGVYLFKNKKGEVIYVGKSARLRARVRSYFLKSTRFYDSAKTHMVDEIRGVEIIETRSEIEALVKESELIKRLKPHYNRLMRDSKNYIFVVITKEDWPRVLTTHQPYPDANEPAEYIGPFTDAKALKKTLRLLRRIFPYFISRNTRTLDVQLGLAPNKTALTKTAYKRSVAQLKRILKAKSSTVLKDLEKQVKKAAREKKFEEASELKNKYEHLQTVMEHSHVLSEDKIFVPSIFKDITPNFRLIGIAEDPKRIEAYDISNIGGEDAVGSMIVFRRNPEGRYEPNKDEYRKFKIRTVKGANDVAMMREIVERRLHNDWPLPGLMVIDGGKGQLNGALKAIKKFKLEDNIPIIALAKRKEEVYIPSRKDPVRAQNLGNAMLNLLTSMRDETHRFGVTYHRKLHRKKVVEG